MRSGGPRYVRARAAERATSRSSPLDPSVWERRYRVRFGRGIGTATIDNTAFDLPRYWSAVSRSRRLDVRAEGSVVETAPGSSTVGPHRIAATRPLVPPCPGSRTGLRRSWEQDLRRIETITESSR